MERHLGRIHQIRPGKVASIELGTGSKGIQTENSLADRGDGESMGVWLLGELQERKRKKGHARAKSASFSAKKRVPLTRKKHLHLTSELMTKTVEGRARRENLETPKSFIFS